MSTEEKRRGRPADITIETILNRKKRIAEKQKAKYHRIKAEQKKLIDDFLLMCKEKKDMGEIYTLAEQILDRDLMRPAEIFYHLMNPL